MTGAFMADPSFDGVPGLQTIQWQCSQAFTCPLSGFFVDKQAQADLSTGQKAFQRWPASGQIDAGASAGMITRAALKTSAIISTSLPCLVRACRPIAQAHPAQRRGRGCVTLELSSRDSSSTPAFSALVTQAMASKSAPRSDGSIGWLNCAVGRKPLVLSCSTPGS